MNFSILSTVKFILKSYFVLYLIFHGLAYSQPGFVKYLVFQNMVKWPISNFQNPSEYGLENVHNFYFTTDPDVNIGVWHFVPKKLGYNEKEHKEKSLKEHLNKFLKQVDKPTVVLYVHGNDRDRATPYRVELCSNLVDLGYHVFALDYRGYGDSTGEPTEDGVVKDVIKLYELVRSYNEHARIVFYGHSLGCGIVTDATKLLTKKNVKLHGVVLEAPFLNASQAGKDYFISAPFNNNKWIQNKIDEALIAEKISFNNDKNILEINSKILIMHAEDDWFIPQYHSVTLKEISKKRPKHFPEVKFVPLEKELGLGHFLQSHKPIYTHIKKLIEG